MGETLKRMRGMNRWAKSSLIVAFTLLLSIFMYQGWLKPTSSNSTTNQMYYFTLDGAAQSVGVDGVTNTAFSNAGTGLYSLAKTAFTGSTSYAAATPASVKATVATLYGPAYASTQVLTNPYINVAVSGRATGNVTWYADVYDYDPAGVAANGTLLWSTTGTDTWSGTTVTNRVLTFATGVQKTIASGHRLKIVVSANSAGIQSRLYFYSNAALYSYFRVDETNPNTDSVGSLADYNAGGLTSVRQGQQSVAMLKFQLQSNMAGGDTWSGGKLDRIGSNTNLGDIKCNIYYDTNNDGTFDPATDQRITNDIAFSQLTGAAYALTVPQAIGSTPKRYFVTMSIDPAAATTTTVGLRIADNTYFAMATGPVNPIAATSSSQPTINSSSAAIQKTYLADWDSGTNLVVADSTNLNNGSSTTTNATCITANTTAAAGMSIVGLLNYPSHTCTSTATAYYQTNSADTNGNQKFITLYFNGPQGFATDMTLVKGISMKLRAATTNSAYNQNPPPIVTYTLFYIKPDGTRVNAPISSAQTLTAATNVAFSLAGQDFSNVPAGSRMGIQIGVNKPSFRITLGSAAGTQLVLEETAASNNGIDLSNGSIAAQNASVAAGTTGAVVDTFNMVSPSGAQVITGLTVTGNSTTNANNVQAVKIYRDNGSTPGALDAGDLLIGTGTFSGNTAVISGMSETVGSSLQEYLVAYDITAAPVIGQKLTGTVIAVSGATADIINNFTSATLTVTPTTYLTNGAGEPANSVVASGGTGQLLDSFGARIDGGSNDTINTVTVTLAPAGISAKVAMVEVVDRGTGTVYGSITAPTAGDDWRVSTAGLQATTGTTESYVRITPKNNVTLTHATTGTVTSITHTTNNVIILGDTGSATVTFDGQAPTDPVLSAVSGASVGSVDLSWTSASDASGLNPSTAYKVVRGAANSPAPNDCVSGTLVYQGNSLSYTDPGLTAGYTYAYRACAVDLVNNTSTGTTSSAMATVANTCNIAPSVVVTPPSQYVRSGDTAQYTINVTNNDTGSCGATTFNLSITGAENSATFVTPSTFSPAAVTLAANGGGANVILYVRAKTDAPADSTDTFQVQVAGGGHPTVTTSSLVTTVNPFGPMLHTSVNVGTKYGTWGTQFTCATCHSYSSTTNIKAIAATVQTPQGPRDVTFNRVSAATTITSGVFGNDSRPSTTGSTNICEVCHHQTNFHQYSSSKIANASHNNSRDCMKCHPHGKGFKYSGGAGCTDCHGYPPTSSSNMASPPTNAFGLNPPDYGAHATHSNKALLTCEACHNNYNVTDMGNNQIEMGFAINNTTFPGFKNTVNTGVFIGNSNINTFYRWTSHSPGTSIQKALNTTKCSVYCHGWSGSNGMNTNPWFVGSNQATCGACHGATGANPPASGSHTKHASTATGNNGIACTKCHGTYSNYSSPSHINGNVEWDLKNVSATAAYRSSNSGGTNAVAPTSPANWGTCSNVYCHSNVQGSNGVGVPTAYASPKWGDTSTATCGSCHKNMYTDPGAPGGHVQHAQDPNTSFDCRICHGTGGDANPQNHANAMIDMSFQGYGANTVYSKGSHTPGSAYGTCSSSNCHGRRTIAWGPSTATPLCEKCHGSATTAGFYGTAGPGSTTSTSDQYVGAHAQHLKASPRLYAGAYDCDACHLKPTEPYSPGHIDSAPRAEVVFGTLSKMNGLNSTYNTVSLQCNNTWCHGAGMDSNTGSGAYVSVVLDGGTVGTPVVPAWNQTNLLNGTAANDCTRCHAWPPSAPTAGYTHYGKTATDCNSCHNHVNTNGTGFVNASTAMRHANGTIDGGCTSCHGNPPTDTAGLVKPAINALTPGNAGAHNAHLLNPSIGNNCSTCHNGYTTQMPSYTLQMGFNAYGGKVTTGTFTGYTSLTNNVYTSSSAGTIVKRTSVAANQNTCSVYCHGAGTSTKAPLGGGALAAPDWEMGAAEVTCGNCHGVSTTSAPTAGSHSKHALTAGNGLGLACDVCHGAKVNNYHVNGSVEWHLATGDARFGTTATYNNLSSGGTGNIAPSSTYASCNNVYCHSKVTGAGGVGQPSGYTNQQWGVTGPLACSACHVDMSTDPTGTGSHLKHANNYKYACATCHNGAGSNTTKHADHNIDIAFSGTGAGTTYSAGASHTAGTTPYGGCSTSYCHGSGVVTWGGSLADTVECDSCHGGNRSATTAAGLGPMSTGKHTAHLNNTDANLGSFACGRCHATTVSTGNDRLITGTVHVNTVKDVAFDSLNPAGVASTCANLYCHSNGKGSYVNQSRSTGWTGAATLTCKGCHGTAASSSFGEPDYSNAGPAAANANSHSNKHIKAASSCGSCHAATSTNGTTITGAAHINGTRTVSFTGGGSYTSAGKTCSSTYCHGVATVTWGGTIADVNECDSCHGGNRSATTTAGLGPITTGKHTQHMNNSDANLGSFACGRCHSATVSVGNDRAITGTVHTNGVKNVAFESFNTTGDSNTCANLYCHSNGKGVYANQSRTTGWTGAATLNCKGCHGTAANSTYGEPDYSNAGAGTVNANSHSTKHISSALSCGSCHNTTSTNGTSITGATHINGTRTVSLAISGTFSSAGKSCSSTYCHSNVQSSTGTAGPTSYGSPTWGGAAQSCSASSCHDNPPANNAHALHTGSPYSFTCDTCHFGAGSGKPSHADYKVDMAIGTTYGNTATYSQGSVAPGSGGFGYCSSTICHGTKSPTWSAPTANAVCVKCHGQLAVTPTAVSDPRIAPGGSGFDTAGNSAATGRRVGAHQTHLLASNAYTNAIACSECHVLPTATTQAGVLSAGHLNYTSATVTFGTLAKSNSAVPTYSSAAITCTNVYCHGGKMINGSNNGSNSNPVWNNTAYLTGTPSLAGDCGKCHGAPPNTASGTHTGVTTFSQCNGCHSHVNTNGTFTAGANRALHINGIVESQSTCLSCHNKVQGVRAQIVGASVVGSAGDDFIRPSRHVKNTTVKNVDCIICHAEGDTTSTETNVIRTTIHNQAGNTKVKLRNVDRTGNPGTGRTAGADGTFTDDYWEWPGIRGGGGTITTADRNNMDRFCVSCHDGNTSSATANQGGAYGIAVNSTSTGILTGAGVARRTTPFNAGDGGTPLDVRGQFNYTNAVGTAWASHHNLNIFVKRYTAAYASTYSTRGGFTGTSRDGVGITWDTGLHCSDCHLNESNAHGARYATRMLQDKNGLDQAATNNGSGTGTFVCYKCHLNTVYSSAATDTTKARLQHQGITDSNPWSLDGTYPAQRGIVCLNCHAGGSLGGIHGNNRSITTVNAGTTKSYRFMFGNELGYNISEANWSTTVQPSCYTSGTTWGGSCTKHNGSPDSSRIGTPQYSRPLQ